MARDMPPKKATGRSAGRTGTPKNMGGSGALTKPVSSGLRTSRRALPNTVGGGQPLTGKVPASLRTSTVPLPNSIGVTVQNAKVTDNMRRPNQPRTPAPRGAPPAGPLGRIPDSVRSVSNGGSAYKGG